MAQEVQIKTFASYQDWLDDRNRTMDQFTQALQAGKPIEKLAKQLAESDKSLQEMKREGIV